MSIEKEIIEIDADLKQLIPSFMENRRKEIESLKEFVLSENLDEIGNIGHRLAGTAGSYGFHKLGEMGAIMEKCAKESKIDEIKTVVDQYEVFFSRIEIVYA